MGIISIDLLSPNKQKTTEELINTMQSMSLYPKMTSGVTFNCAALIDTILTNDTIQNNTMNRLLINNVSDHLIIVIMNNNIWTHLGNIL